MSPAASPILVTGLLLTVASLQARPQAPLDPVPLVAEPFGLRMSVPAGAIATTQLNQGRLTYLVSDAREAGTWGVRIGTLTSTLSNPTPATVIDAQVHAVRATGRPFRVLANEPGRYGGTAGRLAYLEQTLDGGARVINGWLVVPTAHRTFLVFSIVTTADHFARLRPLLRASFSTIELLSKDAVVTRREARLARGRVIVDTLTPEALRSMVDQQQWYRIYEPAASGRWADEVEVGYMSLKCVEGRRGELTPERSPDSYRAMEQEKGLMVMIDARAIIDAQRHHYLDVQGRYWMAWDRSRESWSVRQTQRQGEATRTKAETGLRTGAMLQVIHSSKEAFTREPKEWSIPDTAYVSQAELFLLGSLLPRDGSFEGEMMLYYYDARHEQLPRRVDRWQPAADGSGNWTLVTQSALAAGSYTQLFDANGVRLRRVDADGKVTERTSAEELRRLWRSKGLLTQ